MFNSEFNVVLFMLFPPTPGIFDTNELFNDSNFTISPKTLFFMEFIFFSTSLFNL